MGVIVLLSALGLLPANERDVDASPSEVLAALLDAGESLSAWQVMHGLEGSGAHVRLAVDKPLPPPRTMAALRAVLVLQDRFDRVASKLAERRARATGFNMSGARSRGMGNCPSKVAGARTVVIDVPGGVDVLVTALEADARAEILRRAERQAEATSIGLRDGGDEHGGAGMGSGRFGFCPGIAPETSLTAIALPGGVRLEVRAFRAANVAILRRVTRDRAVALAGGRS
jgi:hypothetical protein